MEQKLEKLVKVQEELTEKKISSLQKEAARNGETVYAT